MDDDFGGSSNFSNLSHFFQFSYTIAFPMNLFFLLPLVIIIIIFFLCEGIQSSSWWVWTHCLCDRFGVNCSCKWLRFQLIFIVSECSKKNDILTCNYCTNLFRLIISILFFSFLQLFSYIFFFFFDKLCRLWKHLTTKIMLKYTLSLWAKPKENGLCKYCVVVKRSEFQIHV